MTKGAKTGQKTKAASPAGKVDKYKPKILTELTELKSQSEFYLNDKKNNTTVGQASPARTNRETLHPTLLSDWNRERRTSGEHKKEWTENRPEVWRCSYGSRKYPEPEPACQRGNAWGAHTRKGCTTMGRPVCSTSGPTRMIAARDGFFLVVSQRIWTDNCFLAFKNEIFWCFFLKNPR